MENCIFCSIIAGAIPASMVYANETVVAFRDTNPQAPQHILIVPRAHISSMADAAAAEVAGALFAAARIIAEEQGFLQQGFRGVLNTGADGGQTVPHLHLHLLAGRALDWPPG